MGLVLQLVETGAESLTRSIDAMAISRPSHLRDIANLGLTLPEAKQLPARVQQAVVAAQARDHAALRGEMPGQGLAVASGRDAVRHGHATATAVPLPGLRSLQDRDRLAHASLSPATWRAYQSHLRA